MLNILKKKLVIITLISIFFISYNLFSAPPENPCDEDWGNPITFDFASLGTQYPNLGSVIYYQRTNSSGEIELTFDWSSLVNNFPGELSDDALKDIFLISEVKDNANSTTPTNIHVLYKTKCTVPLKCIVHLDATMSIECCDEGFVGNTAIYEKNQEKYINKVVPKECGEKCCETVYTVQLYYDTISGQWNPVILGSYKNQLTDCNSTTTYYDCETNQPLPCTGGCE